MINAVNGMNEKEMTDQDKINYLCRFRQIAMNDKDDESALFYWQSILFSYENDLPVKYKTDKKGAAFAFAVTNEAFNATNDALSNKQFFFDKFICYEQKLGDRNYTEPDF